MSAIATVVRGGFQGWLSATVFAVMLLLHMPEQATADLIVVEFVAKVDYVLDEDNLLGGAVDADDLISGRYTYDSECADVTVAADFGEYRYDTPPYGMTVHVGTLVFTTDLTNLAYFQVSVLDNRNGMDVYGVNSLQQDPLTSPGVRWMCIQLEDHGATAVDSVALPLTAPDLAAWPDMRRLHIEGNDGQALSPPDQFFISSTLVEMTLVPEPATIGVVAVAMAGLILRRRKS